MREFHNPKTHGILFHKWGNRTVAFLLMGEEGLQLLGDDPIQQRRFRIARPVVVDSHEGIAECKPLRIRLHNRVTNRHHGLGERIRLDHDNIIAFVSSLPT